MIPLKLKPIPKETKKEWLLRAFLYGTAISFILMLNVPGGTPFGIAFAICFMVFLFGSIIVGYLCYFRKKGNPKNLPHPPKEEKAEDIKSG